ncbi:MAG: hypothetical protein JJ902_20015 [Roseibium sp.]|nr:hypothetical protein [Roseibium sp.]
MVTSYEAFSVLLLLLPGLFGFFLMNAMSDVKVKGTVETLSWILFFTIATQLLSIWIAGEGFFPKLAGATDIETEQNYVQYIKTLPPAPFVIAGLLAFAFAVIKNNSLSYQFINLFNLTKRVSDRTAWAEAFSENQGVWVAVRFKDGTTLVGWPKYYSDRDDDADAQLMLADATWHVPGAESKTFVPNSSVTVEEYPVKSVLLADLKDVIAIEFMEA